MPRATEVGRLPLIPIYVCMFVTVRSDMRNEIAAYSLFLVWYGANICGSMITPPFLDQSQLSIYATHILISPHIHTVGR